MFLVVCLNLSVNGEQDCSTSIKLALADYHAGEYPKVLDQFRNLDSHCLKEDTLLVIDIGFKTISCLFHTSDLKSAEIRLKEIEKYDDASKKKLERSNYHNLLLYYKARLLKAQGNPRGALTLINACIESQNQKCREELLLSQTYNQKGNILLVINEIDNAKKAYRKASNVCKDKFGTTDKHRNIDAKVLGNLGVCHHYQNNFDSAMHYYEKSKTAFDLLRKGNSEDIARTNYNMALILESRGFLDGALEMYGSSLAYYQGKYGEEHKEIAKCYGAIGYVHHLRGDDAQALIPFLKDVSISESLYGKENPFVAEALLNVALSHYQLNDLTLAEETLDQIINILKNQFGESHLELSEAYNRMALVRHAQGSLEEAINYIEKAIVIQKELRSTSSVDYIQMNTRLAKYYLEHENIKSALEVLTEAKRNLRSTFKHQNFEYVNVYNVFASAHRLSGELTIAEMYLDSAQQIVFKEEHLTDEELSSFEKSFSSIAFDFLSEQLKIKNEKIQSPSSTTLDETSGFDIVDRGIKLSQSLIDQYNSEQNAIVFLKKQRAFMNDAVFFAHEIYKKSRNKEDLKKLFAYSELAKGSILRSHANQISSTLVSNGKERVVLRNRLRYLNSELEYGLNNDFSADEIEEVRSNIEHTLDESNKLRDAQTLNRNKNNEEINGVLDRLLNLKSTTTLSYFSDKSRNLLYSFIIQSGEIQLTVKILPNLEKEVEEVKEHLRDYNSKDFDLSKLKQLSDNLHVHDVENSENLLIIPDGILNALPFEILIHDNENLLESHSISYASSADLYFSNVRAYPVKHRMFAIAPSFGSIDFLAGKKRDNLTPLYGALAEVNDIKGMIPTRLISGEEATETMFKSLASNYQFLHIASHAVENATFPMRSYLKFAEDESRMNDGYLYMNELYDLSLNADLVTLSACNTGSGTLVEGEGVMSLARNFKYAGADNVLMSLWKVPDKETAQIMHSFYQYLAKSHDAADALQKAKINYLETASATKSHPFYWAGFVLHGSDGKIKMPSKQKRKRNLLIGIFLLSGLSAVALNKRFFRNKVFD